MKRFRLLIGRLCVCLCVCGCVCPLNSVFSRTSLTLWERHFIESENDSSVCVCLCVCVCVCTQPHHVIVCKHSYSHVLISRKNIYVETSIKLLSSRSTTAHNYPAARGHTSFWFSFSLYDLCVLIALCLARANTEQLVWKVCIECIRWKSAYKPITCWLINSTGCKLL